MNIIEQNKITPFVYGENMVRTMMQDSNPWFSAKDICQVLGLENVSIAIRGNEKTGNLGLEKEEWITIMNHNGNPRAGIPHETIWVNEAGMYRLIFKSRKKEARAFQKWVFHEVLPQIRRTGSYTAPAAATPQPETPMVPQIPGSLQETVAIVKDLIAAGMTPAAAGKTVMAYMKTIPQQQLGTGAFIPKNTRPSSLHSAYQFREITALLTIGKIYTIPEIINLLPTNHSLQALSPPSQRSTMGKLLQQAEASGLIKSDRFRRVATYTRLPEAA